MMIIKIKNIYFFFILLFLQKKKFFILILSLCNFYYQYFLINKIGTKTIYIINKFYPAILRKILKNFS
jgi:hypothetical protein